MKYGSDVGAEVDLDDVPVDDVVPGVVAEAAVVLALVVSQF